MRKQSLNIVKAFALLMCSLISGSFVFLLLFYMITNFSDDTVLGITSLFIFPVGPVFLACVMGTSQFLKSNNLTEKVSDIIKIFIGALVSVIFGSCAIALLFYMFTNFSDDTFIVTTILFFFVGSFFYASVIGTLEAIRELK